MIRVNVIHKGSPPPCLKSRQQCRGCFGWRNILKAVKTDDFWRLFPFRCSITGLTLKFEGKIGKEGKRSLNEQGF